MRRARFKNKAFQCRLDFGVWVHETDLFKTAYEVLFEVVGAFVRGGIACSKLELKRGPWDLCFPFQAVQTVGQPHVDIQCQGERFRALRARRSMGMGWLIASLKNGSLRVICDCQSAACEGS